MRPLLDKLYNFHWIREGEAARSSQAHFGGLKRLMLRHGLKAIINLRGENSDLSWWRYERRVCAAIGARHFDAMLDSRKLPTRAMLARLVDVLEESPRPLLLKCSGGQDRTGLGSALFLIMREGWTVCSEAEGQFARFPKKHQRWLKLFVAFAQEDSGGRPIADWVRDRYEPERLVRWLTEHGHAESFDRIFTTPTRSPWQL
jgi:protein tyrosine/serine phosphatase